MNRYVVELNDRVWAYLEAHSQYLSLDCCYSPLARPQYVILVMPDVPADFVCDMYAMGVYCHVFYKHDNIGGVFDVDVWLSLSVTAQP